ncbi:hypothetical protein DER45DRAFT_575832 [Fusarium avenaceum]|nr:hypothetical protein DER45DRAFT_575832 [Fusarium avenaceum]
MSFLATASKVHLVDGHILKAVLYNMAGESRGAELDLDKCIGNNNSSFEWDGHGKLCRLSPSLF